MTDKQLNELTMENIQVKSNCKKQFIDKNNWKSKYEDATKSALTYIDDEENIFKFAEEIGLNHKGLYYTNIEEYTNKKGITFNAHFTYYGKYYGKCNDNTPKLITCYIPVTKEHFTFDNTKDGMDRFIPIEPKKPIDIDYTIEIAEPINTYEVDKPLVIEAIEVMVREEFASMEDLIVEWKKEDEELIEKPIVELIEEPIVEPIVIVKKTRKQMKKHRYTIEELIEKEWLRNKEGTDEVDKRCKAFKRGYVDATGKLLIE